MAIVELQMEAVESRRTCNQDNCESCRTDLDFLLNRKPSDGPVGGTPIRTVDLFAGCGGMTLGLSEAGRRLGHAVEVALAVELNSDLLGIFRRNFGIANTIADDVSALFDGDIGSKPTRQEQRLRESVDDVDVLLGGPPCQGHSDLNNHTRRDDPKNELYLRMARAAAVLTPKLVIVENVVPVQRDKLGVVKTTTEALATAGYRVIGGVIDLQRVGVPQRRRRFLLIASRVKELDPTDLLHHLSKGIVGHPDRTVRWAINDLEQAEGATPFDTPSRLSRENEHRVAYLFENDLYDLPNEQRPRCHKDGGHSYVSMYGRLRWDEPAQTITTGFGSMGQGRYVHPGRRRTLTPHEAARLQTFPDWFSFGDAPRGIVATAIGNAVPPLLMVAIGSHVIPALAGQR